jgi:hypothetical protein
MAKAKPESGLPDDFIKWLARPIDDTPQPPPLRVHEMCEWRRNPNFAALRAKLFPRTSKQPEELIILLGDLGMEELICPITWTMRMLSVWTTTEPSKKNVRVPTNRILSHVWQLPRLTRIFEGYAAGTKPPPVWLQEIRFGIEKFYLVDDGNHRAEAARIREEAFIRAKIKGVYCFNPQDWILVKTGARNRATGKIQSLEVDQHAAARWLGVKSK